MLESDNEHRYSMLHGIRIKLLMLGMGPRMDEMKDLAEKLHVYDKCIFAGNKSNAADYYQAMDYFCFPSRYEGLPGSVIEAQAAGLQCLVSDSVTHEVDVTELVSMMDINLSPKDWAKKILDDLVFAENDNTDILSEEIKLNKTVTAIAGERRESVFETEDTPDFDLLDKDTGFETLNVPDKGANIKKDAEYSIGDREGSSEYILNKLRNAGFDVKVQAKLISSNITGISTA